MSETDDIERLIRLKRYESPGEAYYSAFLEDLKERQRAGMLQTSARNLLMERIGTWIAECGRTRCVLALSTCVVAVLCTTFYFASITAFNSESGNTIAAGSSASSSSPTLSEADIDSIQLKIPELSTRVPDQKVVQTPTGGNLIPIGVHLGLREL